MPIMATRSTPRSPCGTFWPSTCAFGARRLDYHLPSAGRSWGLREVLYPTSRRVGGARTTTTCGRSTGTTAPVGFSSYCCGLPEWRMTPTGGGSSSSTSRRRTRSGSTTATRSPGPLRRWSTCAASLRPGRPRTPSRRSTSTARQQKLLDREKPPFLWVLMDEKVLSYEVGGREVMRAQLEHLRKMMERPNVIVRFVQPSAGAHRGFDGPFQVISLDGRNVAYAGAQNGGRLIEVPGEVREFWAKFEHISAKALPEDASRSLVERYLEQYT